MNFVEREFNRLSHWLKKNGYSDLTSKGMIICPICQKSKSIESFSKEHIEPCSIGGRRLTITCKDCNTKCGHEIDYTIQTFLNHIQRSLDGPNCKSEIVVNNIPLNCTVKDNKIIINEKNNHPEKYKKVQNSTGPVVDIKLNTSAKWSFPKLGRALIKIAHLMSIPQDNYQYILNECGGKLSDIILGEYDGDISEFIRIITSSENKLQNGYCQVTFETTEIRLCFINLQDHVCFMVILPGDNCSWTEFTASARKITGKIPFTVSFFQNPPISRPDF